MSKIIDYLEKLDLSEIEAKLYLALLESGPITVRELARKTGIGRTTSYPYIDLLIEKELITKVVTGSRTLVVANPPQESLQYLIKQKAETFKSINEEFPAIVKTLVTSLPQPKNVEEAEIKYYKGKNGVKKIYEEALKGSELRLYANLSELATLLPDDLDIFEKALTRNQKLKIFELIADPMYIVKHISFPTQTGRYFCKFIPPHVGLESAGILIYDNKVAILNVNEKMSGIVLYNKHYYTNSKKLFDFIWSILPEANQEQQAASK